MKTAAALIATALLTASMANTVAWAYPTMADRGEESRKVQVASEVPPTPSQRATQTRVVLPPPWETDAQSKR